MNDVEEMNKQMDEELENSPGLRMAFTQIKELRKAFDSALKLMQNLWVTKTCGQCGKAVFANEFVVIYEESGKGVCNWCYMHHYLPYIKEFSR